MQWAVQTVKTCSFHTKLLNMYIFCTQSVLHAVTGSVKTTKRIKEIDYEYSVAKASELDSDVGKNAQYTHSAYTATRKFLHVHLLGNKRSLSRIAART